MSHEYELSEATKRALEGDVAGIAEEYGCSERFIYQILSGEKRDSFQSFKKMFKAVARRSPERARHWLVDLQDCLLRFGNRGARLSNEPLEDQLDHCNQLWLAFINSRGRQEPVEKQRALLIQWREATELIAVSMDREGQKQKLNVA